MPTFVETGSRLLTLKPDRRSNSAKRQISFRCFCKVLRIYIRNHIMTQRYGKIVQRNSFSESCPDDAEFVLRSRGYRKMNGSTVFW